MMDFLNYSVWWWLWWPIGIALAVLAFYIITRLFGVKAGMIAAAAIAGAATFLSALQRAKQEGYDARERIGKANDDAAIERARRARDGADTDGMRNDGFKRD